MSPGSDGWAKYLLKQPFLIFAPLIENVPNPPKNYQTQLGRI